MGQLENCCCCCISVRGGTLIIGMLYLIGSSISLTGLIMAIVHIFMPSIAVGTYTPVESGTYNEYGQYVPSYVSGTFNQYRALFDDSVFWIPYGVLSIVLLVFCFLQLVADVALIFAVSQGKASFVMPWMVLNVVLLVFNLLGLASVSIISFFFVQPFISVASIAPLVVGFVYLAFTMYAVMIVSCYYESARKL